MSIEQKNLRVPDLDLLRFVAAAAVVLYHYVTCYLLPDSPADSFVHSISAVTRYGYLGVDLFFIISGFVILWSSLNRSAVDFFISRSARLFPSFWAGMALTALFILALRDRAPLVRLAPLDARTLAANATMMPGLFGARMIDGVYWTLEIEIRFYAVIFLLLVLRQMKFIDAWLWAWLACAALATQFDLPWIVKYLTLQPYGPFFVAGCAFYLILARGVSPGRCAMLLVACALCLLESVQQRDQFITPDLMSAFVVPAVIVSFFAIFLLIATRHTSGVNSKLAYQLGTLTYPLYLVHAAIGILVYEAIKPHLGLAGSLAVMCALAAVLAYAIAASVDVRGRKAIDRGLRRLFSSAGLIAPAPAAALPKKDVTAR